MHVYTSAILVQALMGLFKLIRGRVKTKLGDYTLKQLMHKHLFCFLGCVLRAVTFGREVKKVIENNNSLNCCC